MTRLEMIMAPETAGDPMTGLKWTKKTTEKIADELACAGIVVSAKTVGRLLVKMNFSLKTCRKNIEAGRKNKPSDRKRRDQQFRKVKRLRKQFEQAGFPVISVDSKKKEKVGNFKNDGRAWRKEPKEVFDHDFPSDAKGKAIPYGIYDTQKNKALVVVGTSSETPEFAVESVEKWVCLPEQQNDYKSANQLMILADCGGGNGSRSTVWKRDIQEKLCNRHGLTVTVCHYPPGASKWNPIEHRLFSPISRSWAGVPLDSHETVLNYIATTTTKTGLKVKAILNEKIYLKGQSASQLELDNLNITKDRRLPEWNYTIRPQNVQH